MRNIHGKIKLQMEENKLGRLIIILSRGNINLLKWKIFKVRRSIMIVNKNRFFHNKIPMIGQINMIEKIKHINRIPII